MNVCVQFMASMWTLLQFIVLRVQMSVMLAMDKGSISVTIAQSGISWFLVVLLALISVPPVNMVTNLLENAYHVRQHAHNASTRQTNV
jgi:hypothetical protein